MKPASLSLGNVLTLTSCRYGVRPVGAKEWQWRENTVHRRLGVPREVVATRSAFVELGAERSRLDYPKRSEFTEEPGKLTIRYTEDGGGTCADNVTELVYMVQVKP